jgi:hypothetical protein
MDVNEPVVEPNGGFVRRREFTLEPESTVLNEVSD